MQGRLYMKHAANMFLYALIVAAIWTAVIISSATWNIFQTRQQTIQTSLAQARYALKKDIAFRRWNAMHGRVYVPVTDTTPPNPYLAGISERDIKTPSGMRLTMINPAYMTRQLYELMNRDYGLLGHITSLQPIRPENAPDSWEAEALKSFEHGKKEFNSIKEIEGKTYMRLMQPFITEKSCLACHAKQGYREGDVRGGISVSIPMEPLKSIEHNNIANLVVAHILFWFIGIGGITVGLLFVLRNEHERKALEEKLQSSEEKYRSIFENAIEGMFQSSPKGYFISVNPAMANMLGYETPEEMIAGITDVSNQLYVNQEDSNRFRAILKEYGKVENFEVQFYKKDKTAIWISISARVIKDNDGNIVCFEGIVQDITAHKEAEKKLRAYADEVSNLYNNAPCGYHSIGPDGTFLNINYTELKWLGYSRDEVIGKLKFSDLLTPDSLNAFRVNFPILQRQGWINDLEYELIRKDGTKFPIILNSIVVKDEDGNFIMNRSTMFDITGLKRAQEELNHLNETLEQRVNERTEDMKQARRVALSMMQDAEKERERVRETLEKLYVSEEALRQASKEQLAIFESLTIGIAFIKDQIILRCNKRLGELFGLTMEEIIGQSTRIWYKNEKEYAQSDASIYEDLKHNTLHRREQELIRKDGSLFWCLFNVRAIDEHDISHGIVCALEDITERKQAERELKERMEELERFSRLTVDRELRMIQLKEEINILLEQMGSEKKYKIVE